MFQKLGVGMLAVALVAVMSIPAVAASESKGDVVLQDFEAYESYSEMKAAYKEGTDFYIHAGLFDIDVEEDGNHRLMIDVLGNWDIQLLNAAANQPKSDFSECKAMAFYLKIPAGCYKSDAVETGRPNLMMRYKEVWDNEIMGSRLFSLDKTDIYYYPIDGDPFIVTNMSSMYPFDQNAKVSEQGFEGYVMIPFDANMIEQTGSDFTDPFRAEKFFYFELAADAGFETEIYVDDFTGIIDPANFAPYGKTATRKIQYVKQAAPTQAPTQSSVLATTTSGTEEITDGTTTTTETKETTASTTLAHDPAATEPSNGIPWLWIVFAAVVLAGGGVAVFLVLKKKGENA